MQIINNIIVHCIMTFVTAKMQNRKETPNGKHFVMGESTLLPWQLNNSKICKNANFDAFWSIFLKLSNISSSCFAASMPSLSEVEMGLGGFPLSGYHHMILHLVGSKAITFHLSDQTFILSRYLFRLAATGSLL
jgi:hypothetical protein